MVCIWRVVSLSASDYSRTDTSTSSRTLILAESRGKIYDTHGKLLVDRESKNVAAVKPTASALAELQKFLDRQTFEFVMQSASQGYPSVVELDTYVQADGLTVANQPVRYTDSIASHIVGYLDSAGKHGVSGIEKSFDELLSQASGTLSVSYEIDAAGRVLAGTAPKITDNDFNNPSGVVLTVDREIQQIAYNALEKSTVESGAVVVLEAKTGAVAAMVSAPSFEQNNVAQYLDAENSPLMNKALCAYSVGSVFKPIIAAAALESGVDVHFASNCEGGVEIGDTRFGCWLKSGHGATDMGGALAGSCNVYFIELAMQLNREYLLSLCENLGFSSVLSLCSSLTSEEGTLPTLNDLMLDGELANLAFGQGRLSASPLQLAAAYLALVCGGEYRYPYLIKGTVDSLGSFTASQTRAPSKIISADTSAFLRKLMSAAVEKGNAAKPFFTTAGGKTATAQSGIYENTQEICRTWFAGFFPADEPEYIVVVMNENGISGSKDCAPVFRLIADEVTLLEK